MSKYSSDELHELRDKAEELRRDLDLDAAIETMNEFLDNVHPSFTQAQRFFLAEILFEQNKLSEALDQCNLAIQVMKDFIPALELRSKIYQLTNHFQLSEQDKKTIDQIKAAEQAKWDDPDHYYHYK
ncbi:MAG: hypothetical protein CK427_12245 [Leptospira sp.]|nr:MAG: hypothetical protein CK427_12245 [Leptospira sp.]